MHNFVKILKPTEFCTLYEEIAWYVNYISIRIFFFKKKKKDLLWALIPLHLLSYSLFSLRAKLFERVAFAYYLYFLTFFHHVSSSSLLLLLLLLQNWCYCFGATGARSWVIPTAQPVRIIFSVDKAPLCFILFFTLRYWSQLSFPSLPHTHINLLCLSTWICIIF